MPASVRITCINKTGHQSAHERISHVGGVNPDRRTWRFSEDEAIAGIKTGKYSFYVEQPTGHRAGVVVTRSAHGHEYLKTTADGEQPNNLLALPECTR